MPHDTATALRRPLGAHISHMLKDRGVEVIFGIPGVHNQEMYRGIEEAGLTHVLARHEQGAGFMADGYARATGRPGVAYVITGPGLCNIMTPMGQAYSDSVPMLVISSCLAETAATKGQLHQMKDQRAAAATVCDWSEEARSAQAAYALIDRALEEFATSRNRPKHIQVPIAELEATASYPPEKGGDPSLFPPKDGDISKVLQSLEAAERPLFIFGGGVRLDATPVVKKLNAAAFTSYAGRGVVKPDFPLLLGSTLARSESKQIVKDADLVVVAGCELAEVDMWRAHLGPHQRMVRIDIDSTVLADQHRADCHVLGDWAHVQRAIMEADLKSSSGWVPAEITRHRARWRAEIDAERPGIMPVCDALRACLPDGTMIYSDMTQFAYAAKELWDMDRPGHWHHPTGFGTLGYATPAAIGGQIGRPGLPTLAIIGDYGFQYTLQELAVAVELRLPLPIFLWDNDKLGEIEDSMVRAQIAPNAVHQLNPDFVKLAQAFGAHASRPANIPEMQAAVRNAFHADGPTLIHVTSDIAQSS